MSLVDLKRSKKEIKADAQPSVADENPYPYGTRISLDTDDLAKLGITADNLPVVGDEIHLQAVGHIVSVSEDETANGYRCGVQIQLEMMEVSNEGQEAEPDSVAEESGEAAEHSTVMGKSVMQSTYRGR